MEYKLTYSMYRDSLKQGLFLGLKCKQCGTYIVPPKKVCTQCGNEDMEVVEIRKEGEIQTFTVINVSPEGFVPPYIVAIVKLDEGPWVMGNVEGIEPLETDIELIERRVKIGHKVIPADKSSGVEKVALTFNLID